MRIKWLIGKATLLGMAERTSVDEEMNKVEYLVLKFGQGGKKATVISFNSNIGFFLLEGELYSMEGEVKQATGGTYLVVQKLFDRMGQEVRESPPTE